MIWPYSLPCVPSLRFEEHRPGNLLTQAIYLSDTIKRDSRMEDVEMLEDMKDSEDREDILANDSSAAMVKVSFPSRRLFLFT